MFIYESKIEGKDAIICVSETLDEGKQLPISDGPVYVVYETEDGKLEATAGTFTDGEFEPTENSQEG